MNISETLQPLLDKLGKAKFTGELQLRLEAGQPTSATLIHLLPFSELGRELVTLEPKRRSAWNHEQAELSNTPE